MRLLIAALALSTLCACSGDSGADSATDAAAARAAAPSAASLCIDASCGDKQVLLHIPEAENLIFSDDGRLFVSGSDLYEIVRSADGSFEAQSIPFDEAGASDSLGGLAIANGVLYLNDESGRGLWAGRLQPQMHMQRIHQYSGSSGTANGLAVGPDGALYTTFGPVPDLPTGNALVRVHLDPADPFTVRDEERLFGIDAMPVGANGIRLRGSTFYVVNYPAGNLMPSAVASFEVAPDGRVGPLQQRFSYLGFFDDFAILEDGLLVANNFGNALVLFDFDGHERANSGPIFSGPTVATWGRPPMFAPGDLLVAERGLLGEGSSDYGNDLALFRRRAP